MNLLMCANSSTKKQSHKKSFLKIIHKNHLSHARCPVPCVRRQVSCVKCHIHKGFIHTHTHINRLCRQQTELALWNMKPLFYYSTTLLFYFLTFVTFFWTFQIFYSYSFLLFNFLLFFIFLLFLSFYFSTFLLFFYYTI